MQLDSSMQCITRGEARVGAVKGQTTDADVTSSDDC